MQKLTIQCPSCGKPIYRHAVFCPYCGAETDFVSVDEALAQQRDEVVSEPEPITEPAIEPAPEPEPTPAPTPAPVSEPKVASEPAAESPVAPQPVIVPDTPAEAVQPDAPAGNEDKRSWSKRMTSTLKKDSAIVKNEFDQKIGSKYSRSTILIGSVITVLALIVLGIFIAVQMQNHKVYKTESSVDGWVKQVLDSMDQEVSLRGTTVAKFPDKERHCMLYLQDKYLHLFDARQRTDIIFDFEESNPRAIVDYNSSGVLNAYLSPNGKYVLVVASRTEGNTECGLYRIDASNMVVQYLDRGRVTNDKEGYQVASYNRVARYDANGDHITGMSGDEAQRVMQQRQDKKQRTESNNEGGKEVTAPAPSVTQQMTPSVDLTPKPTVPEKITIKPVE